MLHSEPGCSWHLSCCNALFGASCCGAGQQEQSEMQGWILTQSPHSSAARSTRFTLQVLLGMNGTALVFFQSGCALPHYKLPHVLSSPCAISQSLSRATLECKRGAFVESCSEPRGQAKINLPPAWCFKQLPPAGRGCVENVWEKTLKWEKAHRKGEKKVQRGSWRQTSSCGLFLTQALIRKPLIELWSCQAAKCQRVYRRSGESPVCSTYSLVPWSSGFLPPVWVTLSTGTFWGVQAEQRAFPFPLGSQEWTLSWDLVSSSGSVQRGLIIWLGAASALCAIVTQIPREIPCLSDGAC